MKHRCWCPRRLGGNAPCCCEPDPQLAAPPSDPAAPLREAAQALLDALDENATPEGLGVILNAEADLRAALAAPKEADRPLGVEEAIAHGQAMLAASEAAADREITRLNARIVDLNAEVLDRMDQWHRDSLARDELARQQAREIARLRAHSDPAAPSCDLRCGHGGDHWLADTEPHGPSDDKPWYSPLSDPAEEDRGDFTIRTVTTPDGQVYRPDCGAHHPDHPGTRCRQPEGHSGEHATARMDVTWDNAYLSAPEVK